MMSSRTSNWVNLSAIGMLAFAFAPMALARSGGISGGGGGTITAGPVSVDDVRKAVTDSKIAVVGWLNLEESRYRNFNQIAGSRKMFDGSPNILQIIPNLKIEFRTDRPCENPVNGEDVDGSADLAKPNQICISGHNLARKLNTFDIAFETQALIVHEVSHLVGTTEDEARAIQQQVIDDLKNASVDQYRMQTSRFLFALNDLRYDFVSMGTVDCASVKKASDSDGDALEKMILSAPFAYLNYEEEQTLEQLRFRIDALRLYVCGNDPSVAASDRAQDLAEYAKGFLPGETQIPVMLFESRQLPGVSFIPGDDRVLVTKIAASDGAIQEAKSLGTIYGNTYDQLMERLFETEFDIREVRR